MQHAKRPYTWVLAVAAFAVAAPLAHSAVYSTPYTPGTPAAVVTSFSGTIDGSLPTFRRPVAGGTELAPLPATSLGGTASSLYPYFTTTFVPSVTATYDFYSAQAHDGYMLLYDTSFDPANPLVNNIAGDDDMSTLNGGSVPNRGGVTGTADSGFRIPLIAGNQYVIVQTTFTAAVPSNGAYYNEVRVGATPATPSYPIPDGSTAGPGSAVTIDLTIADEGTIESLDSITLLGLNHTFVGDLLVTLTHVESGITVDLLDRAGRRSDLINGLGLDLVGDYTLIDGGDPLPTTGSLIAPGTYGLVPNLDLGSSSFDGSLASFAGLPLAGTWRLSIQDYVGSDIGTISGFSLNLSTGVIPEPAALGALAPLALLAQRRRRD